MIDGDCHVQVEGRRRSSGGVIQRGCSRLDQREHVHELVRVGADLVHGLGAVAILLIGVDAVDFIGNLRNTRQHGMYPNKFVVCQPRIREREADFGSRSIIPKHTKLSSHVSSP